MQDKVINSRGKTNDQLCWKCKRATNPKDLPCPWAAKGEPVDGWTASEGIAYYNTLSDGRKKYIGKSYVIVGCPLYVKDREISTRAEGIKLIADALGVSERTVTTSIKAYVRRYELKTGKKIPSWISGIDD